jgi:hypothetical protein
MSHNPYAAPASTDDAASLTDSGGDELAGRFTRLAAAMVDGLLSIAGSKVIRVIPRPTTTA